jgi:hypothetical protein
MKTKHCEYGHPMIYQGIDDCGDYDDCLCDQWYCETCGLIYEANPVCEDESPDIGMDGLPI